MTSRRTLLKTGLAAVAPVAFGRDGNVHAYVGSYTTAQRQARGDGIHAYRIDGRSGAWAHFQHIGNLVNPSLLISSPDQRVLYSAHGDERYATAFSIDRETGELTPLGQADTGGTNGVHLALSRSGKFMMLANYGSGTVAVLPVRDNGALSDHSQLVD
ncbi:MAG TPA: beta-propeller fold lactonase family protein, partial [Bryobacteraceae bacterium]|nr:beta-propeller fold lactonase family protein [Bryobacteraceae bacterium]